MNHKTTSIVLAGVGGQGILLASKIIGKAAMSCGLQVKANEVHGMAQRGGSVLAQIRFGTEVYSPLVSEGSASVLLSLEAIEAIRYKHYLCSDGLAVVSKQRIIPVTVSSGNAVYPDVDKILPTLFPRLIYIDALTEAEKLGESRAANIILLGHLAKALHLPLDAWMDALKDCIKPKALAVNQKAFQLAFYEA
ncbi:MAG: indolepyruvate oxidoreductase subunit beta [Lentisphaeria bacterium]